MNCDEALDGAALPGAKWSGGTRLNRGTTGRARYGGWSKGKRRRVPASQRLSGCLAGSPFL